MPDPFFFFNDTATTEIYTLSLHDALPISCLSLLVLDWRVLHVYGFASTAFICLRIRDRKSTRLNSSHLVISYAVFCLKKKKHGCQLAMCRLCSSPSHRVPGNGTRTGND